MLEQFRLMPEPFRDPLAKFVYKRTYSRFMPEEARREDWHETHARVMRFIFEIAGDALTPQDQYDLALALYNLDALVSMRLMWSAGMVARLNNIVAYNCSYHGIKDLLAFAETMYILMCGTGVGASVERHFVDQLPRIKTQRTNVGVESLRVEDSREGWADALLFGLERWFEGRDAAFDLTGIRPAGARLKTMGGRASGPEPLRQLLAFTRDIVLSRQGQKLRPIDAGDITNRTGDAAQMGGVRRSSEILLFDADDQDMLNAKKGAYWKHSPWRGMANNSAAYNSRPTAEAFDEAWASLVDGGSGEPGIFNRENALRNSPRRILHPYFGTNPCGEIILRPNEFCNLSEVVCRADDTAETLLHKVRMATIFGTIQSSLTNFPYIRKEWAENCREERLLGVSLTGVADCPLTQSEYVLNALREEAVRVNEQYARRLGINPSVAITCNKPSGTAGKLVSSSNGIHDRWATNQITRVRVDRHDPLLTLVSVQGVPTEPDFEQNAAGEYVQDAKTATRFVTSWPVQAPASATTRHSHDAIAQLERWKRLKTCWTEHNPSCTIYVKAHEWEKVKAWVLANWDLIGGLSFLPSAEGHYNLMPQEEITAERYAELAASFPEVDYSLLSTIETEDMTTGAQSLACVGDKCDV